MFNNLWVIIDDDEVFTFLFKNLLTRIGFAHEARYFQNPNEAINTLTNLSDGKNFDLLPDFIFLELKTTYRHGWDFLDRFKLLPQAIQDHSQVCIITEDDDAGQVSRIHLYPFVSEIIFKPFTRDVLKHIQQKVVAG